MLQEESYEERRKGWVESLTKVFPDGSARLEEWGIIALLNGYMWESVWELVRCSTA